MIIKRYLILQEEKHEKKKGTPFKHDLLKTFNVVNKNSSLGLRKEKKEYFYKVIIPLLLFLLPLIRSYHDPRVKLIVSKEHHAPFYEDYSIEAKKKTVARATAPQQVRKKWAPAAWQVKDSPGPQTAALVHSHPYRFSRGPFAICTCLRVASIIGKK